MVSKLGLLLGLRLACEAGLKQKGSISAIGCSSPGTAITPIKHETVLDIVFALRKCSLQSSLQILQDCRVQIVATELFVLHRTPWGAA